MIDTNQPNAIDEIISYVLKNTTPVTDGRKCVDGRYDSTVDDEGMIAYPGADMGDVMVLLNLNREKNWGFTPEECVQKIFDIATEEEGKFYLHTDYHTAPDGRIGLQGEIGCGHCAKASDPALAPMYQLDVDDMKKALEHVRKLQQDDSAKIINVTLRGGHQEESILVTTSREKTIRPHDDMHMFFIYDSVRHVDRIHFLVEKLHIDGLTVEDFKRVAEIQLQATLQNLALHKSIYEVDLDNPADITVTYIGSVTPEEQPQTFPDQNPAQFASFEDQSTEQSAA